MANKIKKEQIIIDFKYNEIKGTNSTLIKKVQTALDSNISFDEYFKLKGFKVVKSLTCDKERTPENFKPVTHKTRKDDVIGYLETIKDSNREIYDKYMEMLEIDDFIVVVRDFHEKLITNDDQKEVLQKVIEKNNLKREEEQKEKLRLKKLKEENRRQRKEAKAKSNA